MKTLIKIFSLIFLTSVVFYSCNDDGLDVTNEVDGYSEGGLIRNDTRVANYVIGSEQAYKFDMLISQGAIKTTNVNIMKTFTTATGLTSNTVLLKNVEVTSSESGFFSYATTYAELREGLEINGEPLPESDSGLAIADYWTLAYIAVTSEGNEHVNGASSKLTVSTRLAGIYTVVASAYIRIDAAPSDFNGITRIIESVDNEPDFATYKSTDIGSWVNELAFYYFYVSNTADADGSFPIIIPSDYKGVVQILNETESPLMVCEKNQLPDMPCNNYARISADGRDEMSLSYGYLTSGSADPVDDGTRQLYELIIKD